MALVHPFIKPDTLEERAYQVNIARRALERPTLVVIPTGMGKTVIALLVIAERLEKAGGKILFMAPTKPLVEQHAEFLEQFLNVDPDGIVLFTGAVPPATRRELWKDRRIIVSTPQVIQNDLVSRGVDLSDVTLIIYDEAHRGVGNYAYGFVQEMYERQGRDRLVLGMTASPGSTRAHIDEVCRNLGFADVQIRSEEDEDVARYVQDVKVRNVKVDLPPQLREVRRLLNKVFTIYVKKLRALGVIPMGRFVSKKDLLESQKKMQAMLARGGKRPKRRLYDGLSAQAAALKVHHAMDLAETQGMYALSAYLERLQEESVSRSGSKAAKAIMRDRNMQSALLISRTSLSEHPKLKAMTELVREQMERKPDSSVIAFTHYRDVVDLVVSHLAKHGPGVRPVKFIGQASRGKVKGLTQKEQVETIKRFRSGEFNVLVATSVAEEGLDIPQTDLVIFYEPVPSEIRTIQRRGRTGRTRAGEVVILITRDTRDETNYWATAQKERRMHTQLRTVGQRMRGSLDYHAAGAGKAGGPATLAGEGPGHPPEFGEEEASTGQWPPEEEPDWMEDAVHRGDGPGTKPPPPPSSPPPRTSAQSHAAHGNPGKKKPTGRGQMNLDLFEAPAGTSPPPAHPSEERAVTGEAPAGADGPPREVAEPLTSKGPVPPKEKVEVLVRDGRKDAVEVIVDHREYNSEVVRQLARMDIPVRSAQLEVGDYVLSERVVVERKEAVDFVRSLRDGRLFQQLRRLRDACQRPVLVVEGKSVAASSGMNPDSIRGALASAVSDFNLAVLTTADGRETALMLAAMARREQGKGRRPGLRSGKGAMPLRERQQFIVEGLPGVSAVIAQRLLDHFGSVRAVMDSTVEELCEVHGVGEKTANVIHHAINQGYLRDIPLDGGVGAEGGDGGDG